MNENLKLVDFDIATVEAMRDMLLEKGFLKEDKLIKNASETIKKLYSNVYGSNKEKPKFKNILQEAENLIFNRGQEKDRQYGPFSDSMMRAARVATQLCDKSIPVEDVFKILISLKISRLAYNNKHDTMLDIIGYVAGLDTYLKEEKEIEAKRKENE